MTAPSASFRSGRRPGSWRRAPLSWFTALCLVSGLLHVWQHHSGHGDHDGHDGHFEPETSDLCQLADNPWTDLAPGPCAIGRAGRLLLAVPEPAAVIVASPAALPPIRAPPVA